MELKTRVDREEALAFLGHRGQELGDLRERLERAACLCEKELVPRGVYREMDASEALALLPGLDIARHVGGCTRVVLLAVTLAATTRFSPGYGDLPLSCQPAFLVASGADRALGICATAAHLLVPAKSITAVIGLYPGRGFVREGARCSTCPVADSCALRAQGRTCYGNPA